MSRTSVSDPVAYLIGRLDEHKSDRRFMLGIAGCPGSGKTTLADRLVASVNERRPGKAIALPMDGFHRYKSELEKMHLLHLRGVPSTFRPEEFIAALRDMRKTPPARCSLPGFLRTIDDPGEGMIAVEPEHRLVIVEGNYLLLQEDPWRGVRPLLDEVWFLDCSLDTIMPRLIERHMKSGMTQAQAREKLASTDLPNARLVEATRAFADRSFPGTDS